MPLSPPSRALWGPRRRTLLASAAGTVLLVGCSGGNGDSGTAGGGSRSADERSRARAARDSRELAARYDAVLAAHPDLARRLRPLRAEVAAHAKAFEAGATDPSPSAAPAAAVPAAAVPTDPAKALAALATAERDLADRRAKALLEVPGELARLLASVAAAGAAHAYLLTDGGK
ncbi:hypothetical protein ACFC09_42310 [Streptomyces sp. NPDC056161]|uniref:hypothetical protein n=1 Tax=Streptomyces sp. NPDC056161 TaxID=3345732 RepID=UPI0035DDF4AD